MDCSDTLILLPLTVTVALVLHLLVWFTGYTWVEAFAITFAVVFLAVGAWLGWRRYWQLDQQRERHSNPEVFHHKGRYRAIYDIEGGRNIPTSRIPTPAQPVIVPSKSFRVSRSSVCASAALFPAGAGSTSATTNFDSGSSSTRKSLTSYFVYLEGFGIEAVADTGAMVDVVSREFIERNDIAWKVIPNSKDVIIFCGDEHAMHTSGYVDATLRFEGSDGLYGLTLYIVDGLPLGINMVLSHNFLIETGTVEFKRPGARTKAMGGFLVAILVAVNKPSLIERLKRHFDRRHPCPPDENQAAAIVNDLNLRARVIEISTQAKANRGPHSVNGFVVMQNNRIGLPNIRNGRDP